MKNLYKIAYFVLFAGLFSLFSCVMNEDKKDDNPSPEPTPEPVVIDADKASIKFVNNSKYSVCVYDTTAPVNQGSSIDITVGAGESATLNNFTIPSLDDQTVFFFEYLLKIGDSIFPYFDINKYQKVLLQKGQMNTITISELEKCESSSGYILLENLSKEQVYFKLGSSQVFPYGASSAPVKAGESAVYEINQRSGIQLTTEFNFLKLRNNAKDFDVPNITPEKGKIYTLTFDGKQVSLKSITPFNIDTQKKIWSRYSQAGSDVEIQIVKPRRNPEYGYLAACTSKENPSAIIMKKIDVYGKTVKNNGQDANVGISSYKFSEEGPNYLVDSVSCIDFVETEDGSCVVLASLSLRKEGSDKDSDNPDDFAENNFLFTYNFDTASVVKEKTFNIDKCTPYNLSFNSLTEAEEGVFLASGFAYNFEEREEPDQEKILLHDLLFRFDSNSGKVKLYIPEDDFTDCTESVRERKISSVFYSAKDNSYYATEIYDFDSSYKSSIVYKSRLLKFDTGLNLQEVILEKENMLFSSITGSSSTGEYYIAGENYASGVQKGLLISSSNIENGKLLNEPYLYKYDLKSYAWFDSVCICGSNIVVSGSASSKRNEGELPIVVAYNKKGELQWANTNYSDYTEAKSCFSTSIGTYLIHLTGKNNAGNYSTIVSADLLGADTGNKGLLE